MVVEFHLADWILIYCVSLAFVERERERETFTFSAKCESWKLQMAQRRDEHSLALT